MHRLKFSTLGKWESNSFSRLYFLTTGITIEAKVLVKTPFPDLYFVPQSSEFSASDVAVIPSTAHLTESDGSWSSSSRIITMSETNDSSLEAKDRQGVESTPENPGKYSRSYCPNLSGSVKRWGIILRISVLALTLFLPTKHPKRGKPDSKLNAIREKIWTWSAATPR